MRGQQRAQVEGNVKRAMVYSDGADGPGSIRRMLIASDVPLALADDMMPRMARPLAHAGGVR